MEISNRRLLEIIKEEVARAALREGRYNSAPPRDSNWRPFADALDIGVLDLDEIAYDLGFRDFRDMDASITPRVLARRDPGTFVTAVKNHALAGSDIQDHEIIGYANLRNI